MTTQFQNGQKVFTYSQALFGGGKKIEGYIKVCKKHTWFVFEGGRVKADRVFLTTEDQEKKEIEKVREFNNKLKEKEESLCIAVTTKKQLVKEGIVRCENTVTQTVVGDYDACVWKYTYLITNEEKDGSVFGRMISATKDDELVDIGYQSETLIYKLD